MGHEEGVRVIGVAHGDVAVGVDDVVVVEDVVCCYEIFQRGGSVFGCHWSIGAGLIDLVELGLRLSCLLGWAFRWRGGADGLDDGDGYTMSLPRFAEMPTL